MVDCNFHCRPKAFADLANGTSAARRAGTRCPRGENVRQPDRGRDGWGKSIWSQFSGWQPGRPGYE